MEVDILFEQIVFLPQRADLLSVHMCSQHHVEFCVQSESDETSYIVECMNRLFFYLREQTCFRFICAVNIM